MLPLSNSIDEFGKFFFDDRTTLEREISGHLRANSLISLGDFSRAAKLQSRFDKIIVRSVNNHLLRSLWVLRQAIPVRPGNQLRCATHCDNNFVTARSQLLAKPVESF